MAKVPKSWGQLALERKTNLQRTKKFPDFLELETQKPVSLVLTRLLSRLSQQTALKAGVKQASSSLQLGKSSEIRIFRKQCS